MSGDISAWVYIDYGHVGGVHVADDYAGWTGQYVDVVGFGKCIAPVVVAGDERDVVGAGVIVDDILWVLDGGCGGCSAGEGPVPAGGGGQGLVVEVDALPGVDSGGCAVEVGGGWCALWVACVGGEEWCQPVEQNVSHSCFLALCEHVHAGVVGVVHIVHEHDAGRRG